jgi:ribosome-binding factor A
MSHSDRKTRLSGLLKELIATYVRGEANSNPMITVTNIDLSPDMKSAIVFVTTLPDGREDDAIVFLKRHASDLRNYLKKKARIKHIPHLEFMMDAGEKHRQHMDELVKEIDEGKKE